MTLAITHSPRYPRSPLGIFLAGDLHVGAATTDVALIQKDLEGAKQRGDRIALGGDILDAILFRDAKRYVPSVIAKRLRGCDDLLGAAIEWAVELLRPFAANLDIIASGNHDDACIKHHSVDPINLLLSRLQADNPNIRHGDYCGFLRYHFQGPPSSSFSIFYWHGTGGGNGLGGALGEFSSKASFVEGADACWFCHKHIRVISQIRRLSCPRTGRKPVQRDQWLLRSGAYSDPYTTRSPASLRKRGRTLCYVTDSLLPPAGRGGIRLVLDPQSDGTISSRVEVTS